MFWSLVLEPGKRYSSTVKESFHLSMATLDLKSCKNDNDMYPVLIEVDGVELILCNLSKLSNPHASLDLLFEKGSDITFSTNGKAIIHLTGYCIEEHSDEEDDYSSSEDEEDESFNDLVENAKSKVKLEGKSKNNDKQNANKRKLDPVEVVSKKKPKSAKDESDDDEDDSGSDSDADLDPSKLDELMDSVNTEGDSSDEDDSDLDDEEDDADDSEGEDEVDDEEDNDDDDDEDDDDDDDDESEDEKPNLKPSIKQEIKTPVSNKQKTPVSNKKQEKQQNKNQLTNGVTPQSNKKDKNKNQPSPKQDGQKTPNKDAQKTPKKGEPSPQAQRKQTLNGGVVVEDLKPGNGAPAKYGKMVQVYYTGRLKNNNRVFDKTTEGSGFKFRLGNGEVIKGWDVALNGMKVGGKRRITIPPGMAYGNKGSPPSIPPNSWLVFDVEMKSVN